MVRRQFLAKLEGLGVTRVDATGQPFDPAGPRSGHDGAGRVSQTRMAWSLGVIRHGYRIGDDVLRPASVAVGKRSESL